MKSVVRWNKAFHNNAWFSIKRWLTTDEQNFSSQLSLIEEQTLLRCLDMRKSAPHFTKRLVEDIYVEGKKPSGTVILKALGIATRWRLYQDAYYYYELSRGLGLRPASAFYSNLITLCGCRKDWNSAYRFYQEVVHEGVPADYLLYRSLLFCCAVLGDSDRIKYVVSLMQKEGLSLDETCHAILMECCRIRKDYEEGNHILDDRNIFEIDRNRIEYI
jgi:pentatricopeptide repeat protein